VGNKKEINAPGEIYAPPFFNYNLYIRKSVGGKMEKIKTPRARFEHASQPVPTFFFAGVFLSKRKRPFERAVCLAGLHYRGSLPTSFLASNI